jgi:glycosyltransferase involved in cell wall biosynthesis
MLDSKVLVVAWLTQPVADWAAMLSFLEQQFASAEFAIGTPNAELDLNRSFAVKNAFACNTNFASFFASVSKNCEVPILLFTAPLLLQNKFACFALDQLKRDPRIATISFLVANTAEFDIRTVMSAETANLKLQNSKSRARLIPSYKTIGPAQLINNNLIDSCGGFDPISTADPAGVIAEFALRASKKGFLSFVDTSSVLFPQGQMQAHNDSNNATSSESDALGRDSPFQIGLTAVRATLDGIRVLIDGTCLGPMEMGTQVQTIFLIRALADRPEIKSICVALPGDGCPAYAKPVLDHPKITKFVTSTLHFIDSPQVDILHRPFQPGSEIPWQQWRSVAKRVVITLQDLIAYRNESYFESCESWNQYRRNLRVCVSQSDGVVVISNDVGEVVAQEMLDVPGGKVFVAHNGTDHIPSEVQTSIPIQFLERQWAAAPFVLALGADYSHKNRDLALRIWQALRDRGEKYKLVLSGPKVPHGSSRELEATLGVIDRDILVLPDIPSLERNWLMKYASLVLYPSGAEGFGFVPFETARMAKPTLYVSFGPLKEVIADSASPQNWHFQSLVDHAQSLLKSPDRERQNIKTILTASDEYTWKRTAEKLVSCYLEILSSPGKQAL